MIRRNFLKGFSLFASIPILSNATSIRQRLRPAAGDREYWVNMITRITFPVLDALAKEELRKRMPVESKEGELEGRKKVSHLEAFGRSMCGLAPWLELGPDATDEGKLRAKFIQLSVAAIK